MLHRAGLAAAAAAAPAALALRWARCEHHACTDEDVMSPAPQWRRGWEADWDGRHPAEGGECSGRTRHIFLIRHGQYDLNDRANGLTALGREQATLTGKRLAAIAAGVKRDHYGEVKIRFAELVSSPVLRAQQSAELIAAELDVPRAADDVLLAEGWPALPWPQGAEFLREGKVRPATIVEEGPRIEAAFRKYIRRDVDNKRRRRKEAAVINEAYAGAEAGGGAPAAAGGAPTHEFIIVVCHMNVIRYFVARALQLPPETWLRMRGDNCGITEIIVTPKGQASLGRFADTGHLSIEQTTFH